MDPQPQGGWIVTAQNLVESDIGVAKNWLSDKGDILFHFNPRPDEMPRHIAMNAYINGSWGTEDRVPLEYDNSSMKNAKWIITVDDRGFRVVDGTSNKLVHVFAHRVQMRMDAWNAPPPALNATRYNQGAQVDNRDWRIDPNISPPVAWRPRVVLFECAIFALAVRYFSQIASLGVIR
jgi:hypothetical protein